MSLNSTGMLKLIFQEGSLILTFQSILVTIASSCIVKTLKLYVVYGS